MKYFLVIFIILGMGAGYYWWSSSTTLINPNTDDTATTTPKTQETTSKTATELDYQTYTNTEWGISFTYPNDWEIREPAFYSKVSMLNLSAEPKSDKKYPETILVNITPKGWIENAMKKMEKDGIIFTNDKVHGLDAIRFESAYEGLPQIDYLILVNNTYWINISGKKGYEAELDQVLDSFVITPVEIDTQN